MELQIIRAADFIRLGPRGRIDLETSRGFLRELASACRRRGISRALVDIRDIIPGPKPRLSPRELASLVNCFKEMGFCESDRLAVLYEKDPHHGARIFAFIGELQGWNVKAFHDFEQAVSWLFEGDENDESARMSRGSLAIGDKPKKLVAKAKRQKSGLLLPRNHQMETVTLERSRKALRRA
jgi:hypothetical protein